MINAKAKAFKASAVFQLPSCSFSAHHCTILSLKTIAGLMLIVDSDADCSSTN